MEKNDGAIRQQIKFSITNGIIAGLLFLFYTVMFLFDRQVMLVTYASGFSAILMMLFDCLLGRVKYFERLIWAKIIKLLICSALSIAIIYGYGYTYMDSSSDVRTMFCIRMLLILLVFAIIIAIISCMEALFITAMVMALGFEDSLFIAFKPKLNFRLEKAKKLSGLISQQITPSAYSVMK